MYTFNQIAFSGQICDKNGNDIPLNTPPPPWETDKGPDDWTPYSSRLEFETAEFLYHRNQMSSTDINLLFNLWSASLAPHNDAPPFINYNTMYETIDCTPLGDVPWESFSLKYNAEGEALLEWMTTDHEVWFRDPRDLVANLVSNRDFANEFDYSPLQEYDADGNHRFQDFMSGDWAWQQAVGFWLHYLVHFRFPDIKYRIKLLKIL